MIVLRSLYLHILFQLCVCSSQLTNLQGWKSEGIVPVLQKTCSWLRKNSLIIISLSINWEWGVCVCLEVSKISSRYSILQLQLIHLGAKKPIKKKNFFQLLMLKILWNVNNQVFICLELNFCISKMKAEQSLFIWK